MTGILFTSRLGSQRLPGKHLREAGGRSFIEWLVLRYHFAFEQEITEGKVRLIIATSTEKENKLFAKALHHINVEVFYGNPSNIPLRHLECADRFKLKNIISIDGDDIFCSANASRGIYENFNSHPEKDIIASIGLPLGMNSFGYTVAYLRDSIRNIENKKLETGWGRIFVKPNKLELSFGEYDIYDKLRFTLDYEDDANFFTTVINFLGEQILSISDKELISVVKDQKFDAINNHLFDLYWNNYNALKAAESNE